jgi:hypothetical protein
MIRCRSLLAVVVGFLFLAGQTCVLPIPGSASTTVEHGDAHAARSAAPAPSSTDGHDHEHGASMSAHCVDSAVSHGSAPRPPVIATTLEPYAPVGLLPGVAVRTLDTPPDVGGPPLFLLHAALLI